MRLGSRAKLSVRPLDGNRRPPQSVLGSNCTRIPKAIANSRRIGSEAIGFSEIRRQLKPSVFAEVHEKPEIVGEGKSQVATGDGRLQRLLHSLLRVEADR